MCRGILIHRPYILVKGPMKDRLLDVDMSNVRMTYQLAVQAILLEHLLDGR
jgi:hypothetical protein